MKGNKLSKILTILVAAIGIIGVVLFMNVSRVGEDDAAALSGAVSPLITYSVGLLVVAVLVTVLASLFSLVKNPEALKKALLGIGVLAVLLAVCYFMSSDAAVLDAQGNVLKEGAAGATSKWVSTGIWYSVILGAIASVFFVYDLVKGLVK